MVRRRKGLSPEDREAWDRVARSAKPMTPKALERSLDKGPLASSVSRPARTAEPTEPLQIKPFRIGETATVRNTGVPVGQTKAPVRMQASAHRRMIRGKLKPEARIDLHGMTLADAHPALIRFVTDAWDRGLRLVLVITGKGSRAPEDEGPIPARRGVLRQQVPGWLAAPPLATFVLEVREAHQRHGGGGAFYVYLRRRR
jgi:DNA-nicking Smr family endonuclease